MHESPSALWAREGAIDSANMGFDLCNAKDVISWLRFSTSAELSRVYLHYIFVVLFWDFVGIIRAAEQTKS